MNKFKNYILMAGGFALLAAVVSGITAGPAIAALVKAALVQNVDERGRVPYKSSAFCSEIPPLNTATHCDMTFSPVPANTRLVIEHVTGSADLDAGGYFVSAGGSGGHITPKFEGTSPFTPFQPDHWVINEVVLDYVEAGQAPFISANATTKVFMNATLTGYLVALP